VISGKDIRSDGSKLSLKATGDVQVNGRKILHN
jgi:hypothetical protein